MFGLDLLLWSAVPVALVALAQMFVVGGSEIDLGIGAFAGLINVVSATLLVDAPSVAIAVLRRRADRLLRAWRIDPIARNPGDRRDFGRLLHLERSSPTPCSRRRVDRAPNG